MTCSLIISVEGRQKLTTANGGFGLTFIVDVTIQITTTLVGMLIDKQQLTKDGEKTQCQSGRENDRNNNERYSNFVITKKSTSFPRKRSGKH